MAPSALARKSSALTRTSTHAAAATLDGCAWWAVCQAQTGSSNSSSSSSSSQQAVSATPSQGQWWFHIYGSRTPFNRILHAWYAHQWRWLTSPAEFDLHASNRHSLLSQYDTAHCSMTRTVYISMMLSKLWSTINYIVSVFKNTHMVTWI